MSDARLTWDVGAIAKAVEDGLDSGLGKAGLLVQERARANVNGRILRNRSGNLFRSITTVRFRDERGKGIMVGSGVVYAAVHEYGATITPKRAKNLAIPLDAAQTPRGNLKGKLRPSVPSLGGAEGPTERASLRGVEGLQFIQTRRGSKFLARKKGKGKKARLEFLLVLKESVTIPARPWLRPAFNESIDEAKVIIADEVKKKIARYGL